MATEIPYWGSNPLIWDQLKINGTVVPGKVKVTVKRGSRLDVRKPPKAHHAVLVDQGKPPAEGEISISIGFDAIAGQPYGTGAEQWTAYQKLEASVFGKKPTKRNAVKVSHPEFTRAGITQVFFGDPGTLEGEGPGPRTIKIPWVEYGKIVSATAGTVSGSTAKALSDTSIASLGKAKKPSANETSTP